MALHGSGGGILRISFSNLAKDASLIRTIAETRDRLVAATYQLPEERTVVIGQLGCRELLAAPTVLGVKLEIVSKTPNSVLDRVVSLAMFGVSSDETGNEQAENDPRLLAALRHLPARMVPTREESRRLLAGGKQQFTEQLGSWCVGRTANGDDIHLSDADRERHMYIIGATGTGKSTLIKSLVKQDIINGEGVVVLDPHGDLSEEIREFVPEERADDVIFADAADPNGRFRLALLPDTAEGTDFELAVDTLLSVFRDSLYASNSDAFGPIFESYFRNALALLLFAEGDDRCLESFGRIFEDARFRQELLEKCDVARLRSFWRAAVRTSGEIDLANVAPYVTSKLTKIVSTDCARAMFPGSERFLDFGQLMDGGKILLLRCPKGVIGEGLTGLAMSVCMMQIRAAAMARCSHEDRRPVRIYLDEFQNCRGTSLQSFLAEGRKFKASLVLANQSLGQIGGSSNNSVGAAILANVGNIISFRLGAPDALLLAPWLESADGWRELCQLPDFLMNARLLGAGRPRNFSGLRIG